MNDLSDVIGGANLYGGTDYSFTTDRFCSVNSSIYFNSGFLQVPPGVYFTGDFTVIAWVNVKSFQLYSRIIDFGNNYIKDNIIFGLNAITPFLFGRTGQNVSTNLGNKSFKLNLNQWYHVAFVLNGTTGSIYVDGKQDVTGPLEAARNVTRKINYIGKSQSIAHPNTDAVYDDLKIYNEAIAPDLILNDYNQSPSDGLLYLN
jgi:hypothetical protein